MPDATPAAVLCVLVQLPDAAQVLTTEVVCGAYSKCVALSAIPRRYVTWYWLIHTATYVQNRIIT